MTFVLAFIKMVKTVKLVYLMWAGDEEDARDEDLDLFFDGFIKPSKAESNSRGRYKSVIKREL